MRRGLAAAAIIAALTTTSLVAALPATAADAVPATGRTGLETVWPKLPDDRALAPFIKAAGRPLGLKPGVYAGLQYKLMHEHNLTPANAYNCNSFFLTSIPLNKCMGETGNWTFYPINGDGFKELAKEANMATRSHIIHYDGGGVAIRSFRPPTVDEDLSLIKMMNGQCDNGGGCSSGEITYVFGGPDWSITKTEWTKGTKVSYQWYRDGKLIKGSTSQTFRPTQADVGHKVHGVVTGSKDGWHPVSYTHTAQTVSPLQTMPATAVTISGPPRVGSTLTVKPGTWPAGATLKYQWHANGRPVTGATRSSYVPTPSDSGKWLYVEIIGSRAGYSDSYAYSNSTAAVAPGTLSAGTPSIAGTAKVGSTLTVKAGTWASGTKLSYQWYANGKAVSNAVKSTFKPSSSQRGQKISVKVTGTKAGYSTVSRTSKATRAVQR
jgi:hypothetical protein